MRNNVYRYYVEGENEKSLLEVLKTDFRCIKAGKIEVFNVVQNRLTTRRIRAFQSNTVVVFIYDTDTNNAGVLKENIEFLKRQRYIKDVICIPQVDKLEDELKRCCNIRNVKDITGSQTNREFKSDFNRCNNLYQRLTQCSFNVENLWKKEPSNHFMEFGNESNKIKL